MQKIRISYQSFLSHSLSIFFCSYLEKNGKLTWGSRLQLALDVAEVLINITILIFFVYHSYFFFLNSFLSQGMKFLHSLKLMHRDLKSPNILLTRQLGRLSAKVADFGLTRDLEVAVEKGKVEEGGEGGGGGIQGQGGVTNPTWLAPEVLMGQRSTLKVSFLLYIDPPFYIFFI